jgi:hypothetical protein
MKNVTILAAVTLVALPLGCASEPAPVPAQPAIVHASPAPRALGNPELQPPPVAPPAEPPSALRRTMVELALPVPSADVDAFDRADDPAPSAPPTADAPQPIDPGAVIAVRPDGTPVRAGRIAPTGTPAADAGPEGVPGHFTGSP